MTETKRLQLLLSELITHPAVQRAVYPKTFSIPRAARHSLYRLDDLPKCLLYYLIGPYWVLRYDHSELDSFLEIMK